MEDRSNLLHNLHRHHLLTASLPNLPPPLRTNPEPLRQLNSRHPQSQQILPPRMQLPPTRRHLDQETLVAEVVINLPVGINAGTPRGPAKGFG